MFPDIYCSLGPPQTKEIVVDNYLIILGPPQTRPIVIGKLLSYLFQLPERKLFNNYSSEAEKVKSFLIFPSVNIS